MQNRLIFMAGFYSGWRVNGNKQRAHTIARFFVESKNVHGIYPVSYPAKDNESDVLLVYRDGLASAGAEVGRMGNGWCISPVETFMYVGKGRKGELLGVTSEETYANMMRVLRKLDKKGYPIPDFDGLDKLPVEVKALACGFESRFQKVEGMSLSDRLRQLDVRVDDNLFLGEVPAQRIRTLGYSFDVSTPVNFVLNKVNYNADFHLTKNRTFLNNLRANFEYGLKELPLYFEQRIPFNIIQIEKRRSGVGYLVDKGVFVPKNNSSPTMLFSHNDLTGKLSFAHPDRLGIFPNGEVGIEDVEQFSTLVECFTGQHESVGDLVPV